MIEGTSIGNYILFKINEELSFNAAMGELQKIERKYKRKKYNKKELRELFVTMNKILNVVLKEGT